MLEEYKYKSICVSITYQVQGVKVRLEGQVFMNLIIVFLRH